MKELSGKISNADLSAQKASEEVASLTAEARRLQQELELSKENSDSSLTKLQKTLKDAQFEIDDLKDEVEDLNKRNSKLINDKRKLEEKSDESDKLQE